MMKPAEALLQSLNIDFALTISPATSAEELREILGRYVNGLLTTDFNRLVNLLYRLDVSEQKIRQLLLESTNENAADIIAVLIIERQLAKIKSREEYKQRDSSIDEDEKW